MQLAPRQVSTFSSGPLCFELGLASTHEMESWSQPAGSIGSQGSCLISIDPAAVASSDNPARNAIKSSDVPILIEVNEIHLFASNTLYIVQTNLPPNLS